ncbi:MAG: hypothetical protein ACI9KE_003884 [Polyangiales bacterium]|jgi:hypothetical protein
MALVVRGDDVWTQLLRSFARLVALGNPRVMMAKSVEDALRWLAPAGASTADDMSAFWNFVEASSVDQVG